MFEKRWAAVSPQLFTSNGSANGKLTVVDSSVFKVKQQVNLSSNTLPNLNLEIKSILDDVTILVGPTGANIFTYSDISAYLVTDGATISAIEQKRSSVPVEEINRAVYEEEPVVAVRNVLVDKYGNKIDKENPLPVDVELVVDSVTVDVALDAFTKVPADNSIIVGTENGTQTGIKHAARVDSELDLRVGISDGANKAIVNSNGELNVIDQPVRDKLDTIVSSLSSTLNVSDSAAQALLNTIITSLASIDAGIPASLGQTSMANSMPVTISSNQTSVPVIGPLTNSELRATPVPVSISSTQLPTGAATEAKQDVMIASLSSIDAGIPVSLGQTSMANSMPVTLASNQSPIPVVASLGDEPIKISGTENGQPNGTEFTFVNNLKQQILAAKDRDQAVTYADFGTKDQRVTRIDYSSPSIGVGAGFTARKTLTYTLVGTRYRIDNITWTLV